MRFYGNGSVWDKENNNVLCRFVNGKLDTNYKRIQKILIDAGYKYDEETVENVSVSVVNKVEAKKVTAKPYKKVGIK